jgi:uncharacterized protein (DUF1499 family)
MYSIVAGLVLLMAIGALAAASALARRPANLGVRAGRLAPCPASPNCVSSQAADESHRVEALAFVGSTAEAMQKLKQLLGEMPRTKIVQETDDYLHAEATTRVFRFVDDVEFYLDEAAGLIHIRSASRVGHSDFGVNRGRVEKIRRQFALKGP